MEIHGSPIRAHHEDGSDPLISDLRSNGHTQSHVTTTNGTSSTDDRMQTNTYLLESAVTTQGARCLHTLTAYPTRMNDSETTFRDPPATERGLGSVMEVGHGEVARYSAVNNVGLSNN